MRATVIAFGLLAALAAAAPTVKRDPFADAEAFFVERGEASTYCYIKRTGEIVDCGVAKRDGASTYCYIKRGEDTTDCGVAKRGEPLTYCYIKRGEDNAECAL